MKKNKTLRNKYFKVVQDFYNENYKPLLKMKEDLTKWKNIPYSCIGKQYFQMAIISTFIYRFEEILIKIQMSVFSKIEKQILKFMWNLK